VAATAPDEFQDQHNKVPIHLEENDGHHVGKIQTCSKLPSDFRPIACVRMLKKGFCLHLFFAYIVLARTEPVLAASQPEEQHGFRCGGRLEEHVVCKLCNSQVVLGFVTKHLIESIGRNCGPLLLHMVFPNICACLRPEKATYFGKQVSPTTGSKKGVLKVKRT